ncbi:MAG: oligosaccharide flippase family protein [Balneolaceae bacterium]
MLTYVKETIKNSAIYGIGNISVKLVGFVLVPFLTDPEYLSVQDYGALGVLEAVNQIIIYLMGLGLYNAMFRWYYDQNETENKSTFFTAIVVVTSLVLLTILLTWIFREEAAQLLFGSLEYDQVILLLMISTGLQALGQLPATLMRLQDRAAFFTTSNVIKLVVTMVVTLYYLLWLEEGLVSIYAGQIVGFAIYLVMLLPYMLRNSTLKIHLVVFREMLGYGFSMMIAGIAGASVNVLDRFVLNSMSGLEEVGFYSLGYKVSSVLKVFVIGSVSMAITPMIFRKIHDSDSHRFYRKTMTYYGFGMMICIMGISLFSKEVLKVFTGSTLYWSSFTVIPILAFGLYFVALRDIVVTGLHITKKTSRISLMTTIISVLNLALNILLIPWLGAEGAAVASLLSHLMFFVGIFYFSNKVYPIKFEWNKIILMFVLGLILVYSALLTNNMSLTIRLVVKTSAIISFPFILYIFNFYEDAELQQIVKIWRNWRNPARWKSNIQDLF